MTNTTPPQAAEKKPYQPPQFQVFGSIREITRNISNGTGKNDNGGQGNQKSQP